MYSIIQLHSITIFMYICLFYIRSVPHIIGQQHSQRRSEIFHSGRGISVAMKHESHHRCLPRNCIILSDLSAFHKKTHVDLQKQEDHCRRILIDSVSTCFSISIYIIIYIYTYLQTQILSNDIDTGRTYLGWPNFSVSSEVPP